METAMSLFSRETESLWPLALVLIVFGVSAGGESSQSQEAKSPEIRWKHISSQKGDLPVPHPDSKQQTGALVADFDKDGVTGFVLAYRQKPPALVWYRFNGKSWDRHVIEKDFLTIEAGGAAFDIDRDGDLDIVFGGDAQTNEVWWWENPYPRFDSDVPWKRRLIKNSGANQHHDQVFGDFKGTGNSQLIFWNQKAQALFLADIPSDPRSTEPWRYVEIFSGRAGEGIAGAALYAEGAATFDVDGDGKADLLAGNYWFKHQPGNTFTPIQVGKIGGRIAAGKFKQGKVAQIVIAPGDGSGPLMFYECEGDPTDRAAWKGRDLLGRQMVHGHTLDVGDINGDGHLDIFAAEMAKWTREPVEADHPQATAWILYGDGSGNFTNTELVVGHGWHEGKLADLDGDGDLDVLNKPYTWYAPRVDIWLNNGTGPRKAGPASQSDSAGRQGFTGKLAMELWTYRRELAEDLPGTLSMIRKLGFTDVETASFYGRSAKEFRQYLDKAGLTCSSYIARYDRLAKEIDTVITEAKSLGAGYVLTAGIPRQGDFKPEDCRRASRDFNEWGRKLKEHGLQFGYHPHGFEFVPTSDGNLFDTMLALTESDLVFFEMDVFWFLHGGADPVGYLKKYPKRFPLMHLKDMRKGTATRILTGKAPHESSVTLGTGMLDMPAILRAAADAGVEIYYLEDESPDTAKQVPASMEYLKSVRF
jgi:sugar phosphate isomerase/epimerase